MSDANLHTALMLDMFYQSTFFLIPGAYLLDVFTRQLSAKNIMDRRNTNR